MLRLLCALLLFISPFTSAEQQQTVGELEIHYSIFPSTFLTPEIASTYDIKRSRFYAVINITVLDTAQKHKPPVAAKVSGTAKNLIGSNKTLTFDEIREGEAVYYIAEFKHANEESFQFTINIDADGRQAELAFQQTFYVD